MYFTPEMSPSDLTDPPFIFSSGHAAPLLRSNTQGADKEQITIILAVTSKQAGVEGAQRGRTHWWQSLAAAAVAFENIHYRGEASVLPPWFERTLVLVIYSHLYPRVACLSWY